MDVDGLARSEPTRLTVVVVVGGPTAGASVTDGGGGTTVNDVLLTPEPPDVVTLIGPVVAALGTVAVMLVGDPTVTDDDAWPPKVTVAGAAKPVPVIVTTVPTGPEVGENDFTFGAAAQAGAASSVSPSRPASNSRQTTAHRLRRSVHMAPGFRGSVHPAGSGRQDQAAEAT